MEWKCRVASLSALPLRSRSPRHRLGKFELRISAFSGATSTRTDPPNTPASEHAKRARRVTRSRLPFRRSKPHRDALDPTFARSFHNNRQSHSCELATWQAGQARAFTPKRFLFPGPTHPPPAAPPASRPSRHELKQRPPTKLSLRVPMDGMSLRKRVDEWGVK